MVVADTVIGSLTTIYVAAIAVIKVYGLATGRSFSGGLVLMVSTALVAVILIGSLTWDVYRKATSSVSSRQPSKEMVRCKGGICWHGVPVQCRSSASDQVRFRLP